MQVYCIVHYVDSNFNFKLKIKYLILIKSNETFRGIFKANVAWKIVSFVFTYIVMLRKISHVLFNTSVKK